MSTWWPRGSLAVDNYINRQSCSVTFRRGACPHVSFNLPYMRSSCRLLTGKDTRIRSSTFYLIEKLRLQDVIDYMKKEHGFEKKKSQYDYQFKKWDIKKTTAENTGEPLTIMSVKEMADKRRSLRPSPSILDGAVIRVMTPRILDCVVDWAKDLPWFNFSSRVLPALRDSPALLKEFFAECVCDGWFLYDNAVSPTIIESASRNPQALHQVLVCLSRDNSQSSIDADPSSTAMEMSDEFDSDIELRAHDKFVLYLVNAVSRSNPELVVNDHGRLQIRWGMTVLDVCALEVAVITCDVHLGEILLRAEANPTPRWYWGTPAFFDEPGNSVRMAKFLLNNNTPLKPFQRICSTCQLVDNTTSPFTIALAKGHSQLAGFLLNRELSTHELDAPQCACFCGKSYSGFAIAIALQSSKIVQRLIQPVLSDPQRAPLSLMHGMVITSCLAGDISTACKLRSIKIDMHNGWPYEITPLLATAWNRDMAIAERLLKPGADMDKPKNKSGRRKNSTPAPIHVTAYHGNIDLVQRLL
ncbi:hypothetical protein GGR57DRAFT_517576 [Xylariaceae sp. FL1272]|nr:hypothetical protein GGR57DRAFT_517576 [Xylariaceae sp. FL1272]